MFYPMPCVEALPLDCLGRSWNHLLPHFCIDETPLLATALIPEIQHVVWTWVALKAGRAKGFWQPSECVCVYFCILNPVQHMTGKENKMLWKMLHLPQSHSKPLLQSSQWLLQPCHHILTCVNKHLCLWHTLCPARPVPWLVCCGASVLSWLRYQGGLWRLLKVAGEGIWDNGFFSSPVITMYSSYISGMVWFSCYGNRIHYPGLPCKLSLLPVSMFHYDIESRILGWNGPGGAEPHFILKWVEILYQSWTKSFSFYCFPAPRCAC